MNTTLENLQSTKRICVVAKNENQYIRIKGSVEILGSGKYYDICNEEADKQYPTKNAILVSIEDVFDLDKVEKIL
jgi:predicted pyridoxine 5'-phosphate oxidase superfamily flavin-nucleotide-binding protein